MIVRTLAAALALGLATVAVAETPNIEPGLWKYENSMTFSGDVPIPDQNQTSEECVTAEDIAEGDAFLDDVDECEITHKDLRRDGMNYSMLCTQPDGTEMTMDAEMAFAGTTANGTIDGTMETPMGAMQMTITVTGERIGDCPAE
ncbi:DUF3617 domain-containing protein [Wenzhouxiangella sp. EGI_FJ10409]|uniref:DUF3617 domain-containing protein n=1 Tax=Wenzhouxiangella sp. EGI_FJ10409 TaxID=3243767 RepID=UPI0035DCE055